MALPVEEDGYHPPLETIRQEGDFIIDSIKLIAYNGAEYDIMKLRLNCNIYEEMWHGMMYGDITLLDAVDLPTLFPIIGEEKIKFVWTRPDETARYGGRLPEYEATFRVYRISNRVPIRERVQQYTLHFVSQEFIKAMKGRVWRCYKDKLYSEIIENIYNDFIKVDKPLSIEPTRFKHDFTVSGSRPIDAIQTIVSRSLSEKDSANYIFYETQEEIKFVTLAELLAQEPVQEYFWQPANVLTAQGKRTLETDMYAAEDMKHHQSFDVITNTTWGMFANRLLTFDPVRQLWKKYDYDYTQDFGEEEHLEGNLPWTDDLDLLHSPESATKLVYTNKDHDVVPHIVAKEPNIKPSHVEDVVPPRLALIQALYNHRMVTRVPGDPRIRSGKVIKFHLPTFLGNVDKAHPQELDPYLSGKWLILKARHILDADRYYTELEIAKDSFVGKIEHVDVNELYSNVY